MINKIARILVFLGFFGLIQFSLSPRQNFRTEDSKFTWAQAAEFSPAAQNTHSSSQPDSTGQEHSSQMARVLISLVIILISAKLGGALLERLKQPVVLGELIFGVILGNLGLLGFHGVEYMKSNEVIGILAEIGVIFLLFEVGLESNVKEMMEVGASSFLVALVGVITPMLLGWGVGVFFLPQAGTLVHVFIGATLSATSVGITARVLKDLGKTATKEARIILGAAVIDDVMGLVILAVLSGVIRAAEKGAAGISFTEISLITAKAVLFLVGAIVVGTMLSPKMFGLASRLKVGGMLLTTSISFCFLLSYLASRIELAPIVGAFAAGLILDRVHYEDFRASGEHSIEELVHPISSFLVPIFFVLMGVRVDLRTFANSSILGFAFVLTVAAIVGKQVCAFAVLEKGLDRISVGIGMIPRGEVGLIFASIGAFLTLKGSPVVNSSTYSAVVIMVIATTLVTPPLLKISLNRGERIKQSRQKAAVIGNPRK